jgi:hypothetical protein
LQVAVAGSGAWVSVVDEGNAVADEDMIFDGYAFTDEGVTGNLAAFG